MEELKILSPTAILGYGFPMDSWEEGMRREPDVIAVDAGSTDPGPYYLGAGISFTDREAVKRDLTIMIPAALKNGIPVIIGTAGGCGAAPHLQWNKEIIEEIAREQKLSFSLAVIPSDIKKSTITESLQKGSITPLYPAPELTQADIDDAVHVVAQMGVEPIVKALTEGAQVILTGRAYDPVVFAALAFYKGYDKGLAMHLGKILECAAIAATPGSGSDCMFGYIGKDYFRVEPLNPIRKCTTLSVAAHTLYEKTNPYVLPGPGGILDLSETTFTQETDSIVRVAGSRFNPTHPYNVKLEGVKKVGCRTVSFAAVADPVMISQIDEITKAVKARVKDNFTGLGDYFLDFKVYGRNTIGKTGVMGIFGDTSNHAAPESQPLELAIIIDAVAPIQETANTICSFARSTLLHYGYPGRISTAGNLAFPFSPSDIKMGDVYEFCMYHVMEVTDPCELFPATIIKFDGGDIK
ncbi:MAG: DUF1446 domain-containing protein [Defluviitaleaceae bacterium]|nr:DUF1446 domain-containing protein [Defluviitaleaceae bacterium]